MPPLLQRRVFTKNTGMSLGWVAWFHPAPPKKKSARKSSRIFFFFSIQGNIIKAKTVWERRHLFYSKNRAWSAHDLTFTSPNWCHNDGAQCVSRTNDGARLHTIQGVLSLRRTVVPKIIFIAFQNVINLINKYLPGWKIQQPWILFVRASSIKPTDKN